MSKLKRVFLFSGLTIGILSGGQAYAEKITFYKSYSYQASDIDSKVSSRAIAIEQLKRLLLEEVGTYVISETEVKNYRISKEHITTLTAGIVLTQVLDEKWDGKIYAIRAKVEIDPGEVSKSIDTLRKDREKSKELEEAKRRANEALLEIDRLKKKLDSYKTEDVVARYNTAVNKLIAIDWMRSGVALSQAGRYREAVTAFNNAINFYPYADFYVLRAYVYNKMKNVQAALSDADIAIQLDPRAAFAYHERGHILFGMERYEQAIKDFDIAIQLDPKTIGPYALRGFCYDAAGNYQKAIIDYTVGIELSPHDELLYSSRGTAHFNLGNYEKAINDFNTVIGISPRDEYAYSMRGSAYHSLGKQQQAMNDYITAARLGSKSTQEYLTSLEINWR